MGFRIDWDERRGGREKIGTRRDRNENGLGREEIGARVNWDERRWERKCNGTRGRNKTETSR